MKALLKNNRGMTLVELMVSMTIFAIIISAVLLTIQYMSIARINTAHRMSLTQELYFFQEQLFTAIKDGGTIDFEEYWNRKVFSEETGSGHYTKKSGFGNYGRGGDGGTSFGALPYLCRSGSGTPIMSTGWCLTVGLNDSGQNQSWTYQRFGQYALQFIDHNYNRDNDMGDEDGTGGIQHDEDDRNLWDGPLVYTGWVAELYLINPDTKVRTAFRWVVRQDPDAPKNIGDCQVIDGTNNNKGLILSGSCLGNVQMLRMHGKDFGWNHDWSGTGAYDGVTDTWVCDPKWQCPETVTAGNSNKWTIATWDDVQWVNLFPSTINVKNLRFELYPQKDPYLAVAAPDAAQWSDEISPFIHPYLRITVDLGFSHAERRALKTINPSLSSTTTISLDDFR